MGGNKLSREEGSDEGKKGNSGEVVIGESGKTIEAGGDIPASCASSWTD